jgi:ketosteroid isomerase-like protein
VTDDDSPQRGLVDQYFAAMRRGATAEQDILALYADDAICDKPFSRLDSPARGRDEVRARLRRG